MLSKGKIKLIKSLELKKFRDREGLFVAEGPKVVGDLRTAFVLEELFDDQDDVSRLSFLKTPQSPFAIFRKQRITQIESIETSDLILALDRVQDPGNLGTIIRIADWFGVRHILCSDDCADVWSPKVIQATMGSLARVEVTYCNLEQFLKEYDGPICGTVLDGDNIYKETLPKRGVIVMGNEGKGISDEIRKLLTHRLLIPAMNEGVDSLNVGVATAVTLSEFRRKEWG